MSPPDPFVAPPNEYSDDDDEVLEGTPPPDPTPDATDTRAMREIRKRKRQEQEEDREFWRVIFERPLGRRVLWDWLSALHTFEDRVVTGMGFPDPYATGMAAGEKSAGMRLFQTWLRYDPEGVVLMLREHHPDHAKQKLPPRVSGE